MSGEREALKAEAALASYLAEYYSRLTAEERRVLESAKSIMHRKASAW